MSNTERTNERFDLGEGIARQELNVIFVIDNSGSMQGEKIGAVNNAIRDVMSIMPDIQDDTGDATIKISAMTFSDDAKWVYNEPKTIEEFKWRDIGTEGATNLSAAYDDIIVENVHMSDSLMTLSYQIHALEHTGEK